MAAQTSEITIARGLVELKTLKGRIERASDAPLVMVKIGKDAHSKPTDASYQTVQDAEATLRANHQSLLGLFQRREAIKRAIVKANANTEVTIGDKKYTLAEAIEMKAFVNVRRHALVRMGLQLRRESGVVGATNTALEARIDEQRKVSGDNTDLLQRNIDDMRGRGEAALIDPNGVQKFITAEEERINAFLTEVDVALNEVNAATKIEVVIA